MQEYNQLEIMPRLPFERREDNPWPQYPKIFKIDYGQEEAALLFGDDPRRYRVMTRRFAGDDRGRVKEVHTVDVEWTADNQGRFTPREIPGSERVRPAQLVLLAMGFTGPENGILDQFGRGEG
jgi:glutamate synthase (NADPH/NADH) small chain